MLKLKSAKEVAEEGERQVLTERREDAPIATPEVEGVIEVTVVTRSSDEPTAESATEVVTERSQGIHASEATRPLTLESMFERMREEGTLQNI